MANTTIFEKSLGFINTTLSAFLTNLVVAVIILLVGFIIGRLAGKFVYKMLHEFELNKILSKAGLKINLEDTARHFITYLIYFIAIIWALSELGLSTIVLNIIFAAVIIIIIVAVLLGIKDFIPNAFAGFSISRRGLIKPGDRIKINGLEGKVKKIYLTETRVETKNKDLIIVPNLNLKKQIVIRKSN